MSERAWDPERKRYVAVKPDMRGRMRPDGSVVPCGNMAWLGMPMTVSEAETYEAKRQRILEDQ